MAVVLSRDALSASFCGFVSFGDFWTTSPGQSPLGIVCHVRKSRQCANELLLVSSASCEIRLLIFFPSNPSAELDANAGCWGPQYPLYGQHVSVIPGDPCCPKYSLYFFAIASMASYCGLRGVYAIQQFLYCKSG